MEKLSGMEPHLRSTLFLSPKTNGPKNFRIASSTASCEKSAHVFLGIREDKNAKEVVREKAS
jgi:hypothetical protein